jgi:hypothetical protein
MASVVWPPEVSEIPTDLYYSDIYDANSDFSSWDTNNNGRYSEYNFNTGSLRDEVDLYPDVKIGRLLCSSIIDVYIVVNKIITYETETYGSEWFNKIILMGGDTFPEWGVYEGEVVTYHVEQEIQEFDSVRLWTSYGNFNPKSINKEISKGAGFVSYSGHGYFNGFGTSSPHDPERIEYHGPYLFGLLNKDRLPIIFFDACSTVHLDYVTPLGILYPCFAWAMVLKPGGGAVATVGATRIAYSNTDERGPYSGAARLNINFFHNYEPGTAVSNMFINAINDYLNNLWKDYVTIEEYLLVGDPSLKIGGYP